MLSCLWHWLTTSNDESWRRMPKTWLQDEARLAVYSAWTARELASAYVVKDSAAFQREAFWEAFEAKQRAKVEVKRGPARITRIA